MLPDAAAPKGDAAPSHTHGGRHRPTDDTADVAVVLAAVRDVGVPIHFVGRRPGKAIDPLLTGRVLVVGDDADLAAVVLRLVRRDFLGDVEIAYATAGPGPVSSLHRLAVGAEAVRTAVHGTARPVTLVRSDGGGVLVGRALIGPFTGSVWVDAERVASGATDTVVVTPDPQAGVAVTVRRRRPLGLGWRETTTSGRAVEFGFASGECPIVVDGVTHPRVVNRWVFYRHTAPLHLVC